jgi:hypothetical protein
MKVYTYSQARQQLAAVLEEARREGAVRIQRKDGHTFVIMPEQPAGSPLDIVGVPLDITTAEIIEVIRESRTRDDE